MVAVRARGVAVRPLALAVLRACLPALLLLSACSGGREAPPVPAAPRPPPPRPQPAAVDPSNPDQVRAEIVRWFTKRGYQPYQVEAMADHAKAESGFRPCASAGDRRYTYQWSGLRLRRLIAYARVGDACPPIEKQLVFADYELRVEPAFSCFWGATTRAAALSALRRGFGRGRC
jgi:hypothetical protein